MTINNLNNSPWVKNLIPNTNFFRVTAKETEYPTDEDVFELVRSGTQVRSLDFSAVQLSTVGLTTLSLLGKTLISLELESLTKKIIRKEDSDWIVPILISCKLLSLTLKSTSFSDRMVEHICKEGKQLLELNLHQYANRGMDEETISDESLQNIANSLKKVTRLTLVSFKEITTDGLLLLTSIQNLTEVNLQGCAGVNDELILAFFKKCTSISTFSLYDSSITERGMAAICSSKKIVNLGLHECQELKTRDFCMLSVLEKLKILYLSGIAINSTFLKVIPPALDTLGLFNTSISPNEIEDFKQKHPKIDVSYKKRKPEEPSKGWLGGLFG